MSRRPRPRRRRPRPRRRRLRLPRRPRRRRATAATCRSSAGTATTTTAARDRRRRPPSTTPPPSEGDVTPVQPAPTAVPVTPAPAPQDAQLVVTRPDEDTSLLLPALLLAAALARPRGRRRLGARRARRPLRRVGSRLARGRLPRHRRVGRFQRLAARRPVARTTREIKPSRRLPLGTMEGRISLQIPGLRPPLREVRPGRARDSPAQLTTPISPRASAGKGALSWSSRRRRQHSRRTRVQARP